MPLPIEYDPVGWAVPGYIPMEPLLTNEVPAPKAMVVAAIISKYLQEPRVILTLVVGDAV